MPTTVAPLSSISEESPNAKRLKSNGEFYGSACENIMLSSPSFPFVSPLFKSSLSSNYNPTVAITNLQQPNVARTTIAPRSLVSQGSPNSKDNEIQDQGYVGRKGNVRKQIMPYMHKNLVKLAMSERSWSNKPLPGLFPVLWTHVSLAASVSFFFPEHNNAHYKLEYGQLRDQTLIGYSNDGIWGIFQSGGDLKLVNGHENIILPKLPSGGLNGLKADFSFVNDDLVVVVLEHSIERTMIHRMQGMSFENDRWCTVRSSMCMAHVRLGKDLFWFDIDRRVLIQLKGIFMNAVKYVWREWRLPSLYDDAWMVCSLVVEGAILALVETVARNFVIGRIDVFAEHVRINPEPVELTGVNVYAVAYEKGFMMPSPNQDIKLYLAGYRSQDCQKVDISGVSQVIKFCDAPPGLRCGCGHSWMRFEM